MSQILKVLELAEQHRVAQMQIGRGRVETGLDAQRSALAGAQQMRSRRSCFADQFDKPLPI